MPFVAGTALTAAQLNTLVVSAVGGVLLTSTVSGMASATPTDVTWDVEVSDPDAWHVAASATLTVPTGKGGRYVVTYQGIWSADPGAAPGVACMINGTGTYEAGLRAPTSFTYWAPVITFLRTFAAGDTIKFVAYQNSGSTRNLQSRLEIAPA